MPQIGLHASLGLFLRRPYPQTPSMVLGIFTGNILPDADMFLTSAIYLFNEQVSLYLHRTFFHSWIVILALLGIVFVLGKIKGANYYNFGIGLCFGMAFHALLDVFFWFASVDLFWPLSIWGIIPVIDIWKNFAIPVWVGSLGIAGEFLSYGIFYTLLRIEMGRLRKNAAFIPLIHKIELGYYAIFIIYCALVPLLPYKTMVLVGYIPLLIVALPIFIWVILKVRPTIALAM